MGVALAVLVVAGVAVLVVRPLWRPALEPVGEDVTGPASELVALEERKQSIYGAIRELGFDYRTDKLIQEDYRQEMAHLKAEAVEVVARIEELRSSPPRGREDVEADIAAIRERLAPTVAAGGVASGDELQAADDSGGEAAVADDAVRFCPRCGRRREPADRFCAGCGRQLAGGS